jgi:hypothetical protein
VSKGKQVRRRRSVDIQIGPNLRNRKKRAEAIIGLTLGTILFFVVSYLMVYGHVIHH